jgi:hypothetical protein
MKYKKISHLNVFKHGFVVLNYRIVRMDHFINKILRGARFE